MTPEVNENQQKRTSISVTIPALPVSVHNKIKLYRRKIMLDRNKDYSMMAAYAEFLKEYTKTLEI